MKKKQVNDKMKIIEQTESCFKIRLDKIDNQLSTIEHRLAILEKKPWSLKTFIENFCKVRNYK